MSKHGKKFTDATRRFDRERLYPATEALDLVKSLATRKFDETVEAAFRLGVDPRKADQMIRGTVSLPKGTGKDVRVAVFAEGDAAREAEEAGADVVGSDDLVAQIEKGFLDFDVAIATPDMMSKVGKLGRTLGPRNLMPNPKAGTVRYGNVHVPIGKASFDSEDLLTNYQAVLDEVLRAKPAASKGRYLRGVALSSSMGPGVRVDPTAVRDELAKSSG